MDTQAMTPRSKGKGAGLRVILGAGEPVPFHRRPYVTKVKLVNCPCCEAVHVDGFPCAECGRLPTGEP